MLGLVGSTIEKAGPRVVSVFAVAIEEVDRSWFVSPIGTVIEDTDGRN